MKKKMCTTRCAIYGLFLLSIFFLPRESFSEIDKEQTIEIFAEVESDIINIGDKVNLDVTVENISDCDIVFPEVLENTVDFSFIGSEPIKEGWPGKKEIGRRYTLTIYEIGTHVIPPVKARYKRINTDEWQIIESSQIPIEVVSLLTEDSQDIRDIKGLAFRRTSIFWYVILFFVVTGLLVGVGLLLRGKKMELKDFKTRELRPAHKIAYEELRRLKEMDLPNHGRIKEYYSILSDIVRHYIENRFVLRAPEMTTEEFMKKVGGAKDLADSNKDLLKRFLYHCDMVKFAKYEPTQFEMLDSYKLAGNFVDETRVFEEDEDVKAG
ncbi:MAG: hypothetical protein KAI70_01450 [Candidatus Omnitrophica bacterium]|nr:hypothetical protein [Candidatus Omnitrophota bacterium]